MIIETLLVISVLANVVLVWYTIQMLKRFFFLQNTSADIYDTIMDYKKHLREVYEMETFYGDQTLFGLLSHTNDLAEDLEIYKVMFATEEEVPVEAAEAEEETAP